jgi:hypothetical protein
MSIVERETRLVNYNLSDAAIAAMAESYLPLTINGINDIVGYKQVHEARMVVKNKRVEVENTRVQLKADALQYGRAVDAEAQRLTVALESIEHPLEVKQRAIDDEKERLKNAARLQAEAEARLQAEAEEARLKAIRDAEDARLKVEREKLDADRREMEAAQKAEQERLYHERLAEAAARDAERSKLDAERAVIARVRVVLMQAADTIQVIVRDMK